MGYKPGSCRLRPRQCDGCGKCMAPAPLAKDRDSTDTTRSLIQIVRSGGPASVSRRASALCRQCGDPPLRHRSAHGRRARKDGARRVIGWDASKCVDFACCTIGCTTPASRSTSSPCQSTTCAQALRPACPPAPPGRSGHVTTSRIYNGVGDWEDLFAGPCRLPGCNTELLMRHALRRVGPDTVLATPPGCVPGMGSVGFNGTTGTFSPGLPTRCSTNTASAGRGSKRQYKRVGRGCWRWPSPATAAPRTSVSSRCRGGRAQRAIFFMVVDNAGAT